MKELKVKYNSAKVDIQDAWDNPVRKDSRITRDWIYSVDPETMAFCKALFKFVKGDMSLYDVFTSIMKNETLEKFKEKCFIK